MSHEPWAMRQKPWTHQRRTMNYQQSAPMQTHESCVTCSFPYPPRIWETLRFARGSSFFSFFGGSPETEGISELSRLAHSKLEYLKLEATSYMVFNTMRCELGRLFAMVMNLQSPGALVFLSWDMSFEACAMSHGPFTFNDRWINRLIIANSLCWHRMVYNTM